MIVLLKPDEIDQFWDKAREVLMPSFRYLINSHSVDDYYNHLKEGSLHLWLVLNDGIKGAVVTAFNQVPAGKTLYIYSMAGEEFKDWVHQMDEALSDYAKENGCIALEMITRKGFSRYLPDYQEDGVIYVKMLGDK